MLVLHRHMNYRMSRCFILMLPDERRSGDPAVLVESSEKIRTELGWMPRYSNLDSIIKYA